MSVNDGAATSRLFVAHPQFWGSKMAFKTTGAYKSPVKLVTFYLIVERAFVGSRQVFSADIADKVFRYGGIAVLLVGLCAYCWWSPALRAASSAKLCS